MVLTFIIDCLATYRLTKLIVEDEILTEPRVALIEKVGEDSKLGYLMSCPWCMGFWVGILVVGCRAFAPRVWHSVATALALSAAAGYLSEH